MTTCRQSDKALVRIITHICGSLGVRLAFLFTACLHLRIWPIIRASNLCCHGNNKEPVVKHCFLCASWGISGCLWICWVTKNVDTKCICFLSDCHSVVYADKVTGLCGGQGKPVTSFKLLFLPKPITTDMMDWWSVVRVGCSISYTVIKTYCMHNSASSGGHYKTPNDWSLYCVKNKSIFACIKLYKKHQSWPLLYCGWGTTGTQCC